MSQIKDTATVRHVGRSRPLPATAGIQRTDSWAYGTHRVAVARIAAATLGGKR